MPVITRIGIAAEGDIRRLLSENNAIDHCHAVSLEQTDLFTVRIELVVRMQDAGNGSIIVGPYQQIATGRYASYSRVVARKAPLRGCRQIICQIHPAHVNRIGAVIIDFDPIIIVTLRVLDSAPVRCQEFVDNQRRCHHIDRTDQIYYHDHGEKRRFHG